MIVPHRVIEELDKHSKSRDGEKIRDAVRGHSILAQYQSWGIIDIRGESTDDFADQTFLAVFMRHRLKHNLCLVTQDRGLAMDTLALRKSDSVTRGMRDIRVLKILRDGSCREWELGNVRSRGKSSGPGKPPGQRERCESSRAPRFQLRTGKPARVSQKAVHVHSIPKKSDYVTAGNQTRLRLSSHIGSGGEGDIYLTDKGDVCKIYHKDRITEAAKKKLELMVSNPLDIPGVCWPKVLVQNRSGDFVGFTMRSAEGRSLKTTVFAPKPVFLKTLPRWNRLHLVTLAINIVDRIRLLHQENILLGDLNAMNILIASENEIYFVDTDSYQVNDFPCPVAMVNYKAPEIQDKDCKEFLRTPEHERFALATLLFMILLPGKPPYSQQGGADPARNIKSQDFSYPLGGKSNQKQPLGPWRFIWSHMTYKVKEAFYECFKNGKRPSADEWKQILESYRHSLEKGHVSDELFPTGLKEISEHAQKTYGKKKSTDEVTLRCDACGNSFDVSKKKAEKITSHPDTLCWDCLQRKQQQRQQDSVTLRCDACGCSFSLSSQKAAKATRHQDVLCYDCWKQKQEQQKRKRETGDWLVCVNCRNQFLFSINDQEFFQKKGFTRPKRCPNCRGQGHGQRRGGHQSSSEDVFGSIGNALKSIWDDIWR